MIDHSPGPWIAERADLHGEDGNRWSVLFGGDRKYFIASIENGCPGDTMQTEEANARLIAAAPDLLAVCRAMARIVEYVPDPTGMIRPLEIQAAAEAAIAKATVFEPATIPPDENEDL